MNQKPRGPLAGMAGLKASIEREVKALEAKPTGHFCGHDWFQVSEEEAWVFGIDRARVPRMVVALQAFEAMLGIIYPQDAGLTEEDYEAGQAHFHFGNGTDLDEFQRFATERAGLTTREARAFYWKHEFWLHRRGLVQYPDELP
jgi:hypothetical protein